MTIESTKPAKYQFGEFSFATKADVKKHCSETAKRYGNGGRVLPGTKDYAFLADLVDRHPSAAGKIGCGVERFESYLVPPYNNSLGFRIVRTDGSVIDFSWNICLDGKNAWTSFVKAARSAINDQILEYKRMAFEAGPVKCAISGVDLSPNDCHIDHVYPQTFSALIDGYVRTVLQGDWQNIQLVDGPFGIPKVFANKADGDRFADYHRQWARLQTLAPDVNMKIGNRDPKAQ